MHAAIVTDPSRLRYISIDEHKGNTKKILSMPGIDLYMAKNILCLGQSGGQCLLPIKPGELDIVFTESFRHTHTDLAPLMSYIHGLQSENSMVIDEAVPLFPVWNTNFWHWIFESFPVILVMEKAGYKGYYIVPELKFCIELADMVGVPKDRLLFPGKQFVIKNAIIPKLGHGISLTHAPETVQRMRSEILNAVGVLPGFKFVYARRGTSRRIINEEQLLEVLEKFDFQAFMPETLPVREQFRFMSNSAVTLMPHGASLALTLAKPESSALIECFSYALVDYCCLPTVNLLNLLYFAIPQTIGSGHINAVTEASDWQDFTVDITMLEVLLKNLFSRKGMLGKTARV